MAQLTQDRNTQRADGDIKLLAVAASQTIFMGAIVARNASGFAAEGITATTLIGVGRAEERITNSGSAGDMSIKVRTGIFRYGNSAAGDLIAADDIGKPCYIVDDQTVALTDGTGTRSIAGFIHDVDAQGVWVEFDEAKAKSYATLAAAIAAIE